MIRRVLLYLAWSLATPLAAVDVPGEADILEIPGEAMEFRPAPATGPIRSIRASAFHKPDNPWHPLHSPTGRILALLRLQNNTDRALTRILEINNPYLSAMTLYRLRGRGMEPILQAGLSYPLSGQILRSRLPVVSLDLQPGERAVLIFDIKPVYSYGFPVRLYQPAAWHSKVQDERLVLGIFSGMLLCLIIYNLYLFASIRDPIYLLYSATLVFTHLLLVLSIFGIVRFYMLPDDTELIGRSFQFVAGIGILIGSWFCRDLISMKKWMPRLNRVFNLTLWLITGVLTLTVVQEGFNTLPLLAPLCAGLLFMGLVAAWATVRRGEPMARYLFLGWALYFGMATPFLLYISGFGPRSFFANWGVVIGTVCEALIFSFALGDRLQLIRQARSAKEKQLASLRQNMTGLMNGGLMQKLADNPVAVRQDPVISTMTVMFIDLPDDSLSASRFGPTGHFLRLRECMDDIARTVLHYDGVIDKSPAEGILCFFGYQFLGNEVPGHENQAIRCALALQRQSMQQTFGQREHPQPVISPLRIGMNTGPVCVGNMGNESRFDIVLSGETVTRARRLLQACEPFHIMMGEATRDRSPPRLQSLTDPRLLPPPDQGEQEVAWELIAEKNPKRLDLVREIYRKYRNQEQGEMRSSLTPDRLRIRTTYGIFDVINISEHGLGVEGDFFLGCQHHLEGDLLSPDRQCMEQIDQALLGTITLQVVWGRKIGANRFRHGLRITSLSHRQREYLGQIIGQAAAA